MCEIFKMFHVCSNEVKNVNKAQAQRIICKKTSDNYVECAFDLGQ